MQSAEHQPKGIADSCIAAICIFISFGISYTGRGFYYTYFSPEKKNIKTKWDILYPFEKLSQN